MRINQVGASQSLQQINKHTEEVSQEVSVQITEPVKHVEESKASDEKSESVINDEMLEKSVEQANKSLKVYNRKIERNIHEVTKAIMYTMKDTETDEVIKEFPPRKIQDMIAKMWELAGLFVDEKA